jgi:hypothetical protein
LRNAARRIPSHGSVDRRVHLLRFLKGHRFSRSCRFHHNPDSYRLPRRPDIAYTHTDLHHSRRYRGSSLSSPSHRNPDNFRLTQAPWACVLASAAAPASYSTATTLRTRFGKPAKKDRTCVHNDCLSLLVSGVPARRYLWPCLWGPPADAQKERTDADPSQSARLPLVRD